MKAEYDFSQAEKGKFYNPNAAFHFPIYLDPDVNEFMNKLAQEQNIDPQTLVNEWLRSKIKLIQEVE
jgi:hypothetical protein